MGRNVTGIGEERSRAAYRVMWVCLKKFTTRKSQAYVGE